MKTMALIFAVLLFIGTTWTRQAEQKPYDIVLRDDQEPMGASFQSENRSFGVMSCGEYGFGASSGAKIEIAACTTEIKFAYVWRGDKDFSFHPRKKPDVTVTIKAGDNLHGEFIINTCEKTATGLIRDDNQNLILMKLNDSDITDSENYCCGPPD